jgi:putative heme-binding domain-containing protein
MPRFSPRLHHHLLQPLGWLAVLLMALQMAVQTSAADTVPPPPAGTAAALFRTDELAAWCIVPFDDEPRTPTERMAMLQRLGITRYAYDYRAEHIPQFDEEMLQLKAAGIELVGWWFPTVLNDEARLILNVLKRHQIQTSLWVTGGGEPTTSEADQQARVTVEAARIRPIAEAAAEIGCTVGLYNHGGWFGEPENQIAIIKWLAADGIDNVRIVYNQHHGHGHVDRWQELLTLMQPHLEILNLNGMFSGEDGVTHKIAPIGQGNLDINLLTAVVESGYEGPFGILNHTQLDAEERLADNLAGLAWVASRIDGDDSSPKPAMKTWAGLTPSAEARAFAAEALEQGDAVRGAEVFARHTLACLSCHRVGEHGGRVGPGLEQVGRERSPEWLADALLHPQRHVAADYEAVAIVTTDGSAIRGYRLPNVSAGIRLRDPVNEAIMEVPYRDIDGIEPVGSLMPTGLLDALSPVDRRDLLRFLIDLGRHELLSADSAASIIKQAHSGVPAAFVYGREPLDPAVDRDWQLPVNRDRVFDFYAKEARFFRDRCPRPVLTPPYPGLDGGSYGHWGNQNEDTWRSNHWNETVLGSLQAGVLHAFGETVPRAVCVQLEEDVSACFDPDSLSYRVVWKDGFIGFSDVRAGFLGGLIAQGTRVDHTPKPPQAVSARYEGFCRSGSQVGFLYSLDGVRYLDVPQVVNGEFARQMAPLEDHPQKHLVDGGEPQWPQVMETQGELGTTAPFAVDTLTLPHNNPWNALLYCGGHDFLPDGSLVVCTMQGDVWRVTGVDDSLSRLQWRRIASGLHQPLGLLVVDETIHVLGRDQITRLHDTNNDGEIDHYECFSRAYVTSPGGHDYVMGLERDDQGRFLTASSNQGLLRIAADGQSVEVLATGLRNPDGLGLTPSGLITAASSEGDWVPASLIAAIPKATPGGPLHFGHGGLRDGQPPALPLAYLPRGEDNSSGGQAWCPEGALGPLGGHLVHLSFGTGTAFLLLEDEVGGQLQGAVVPLPVSFRSGSHRGRFHPSDGHLYVSGMNGWGSYTPDPGCLERIRFVQPADHAAVQMPVGFHVHDNGVVVRFAEPVDASVAADPARQFAQCWSYRYGGGYGSPEFSTQHEGVLGHDHLPIRSCHVFDEGRSVFYEIPEIEPVNQLQLCLETASGQLADLIITVNALDTSFAGGMAAPRETPVRLHPMLSDIARLGAREPNPFAEPIAEARAIEIVVGPNLSYLPRELTASPGEPLAVTLINPDVVPHNWALAATGSLSAIGEAVNRLIADPEAVARQYIPDTEQVLAYTDIVPSGERQTIYLTAPNATGRYPFLCTFPGHWMVMNGELVVQ